LSPKSKEQRLNASSGKTGTKELVKGSNNKYAGRPNYQKTGDASSKTQPMDKTARAARDIGDDTFMERITEIRGELEDSLDAGKEAADKESASANEKTPIMRVFQTKMTS